VKTVPTEIEISEKSQTDQALESSSREIHIYPSETKAKASEDKRDSKGDNSSLLEIPEITDSETDINEKNLDKGNDEQEKPCQETTPLVPVPIQNQPFKTDEEKQSESVRNETTDLSRLDFPAEDNLQVFESPPEEIVQKSEADSFSSDSTRLEESVLQTQAVLHEWASDFVRSSSETTKDASTNSQTSRLESSLGQISTQPYQVVDDLVTVRATSRSRLRKRAKSHRRTV
jgi:hypothetical protein